MDRNEKQNSYKNRKNTRGMMNRVERLEKQVLLMRLFIILALIAIAAALVYIYLLRNPESDADSNPGSEVSVSSFADEDDTEDENNTGDENDAGDRNNIEGESDSVTGNDSVSESDTNIENSSVSVSDGYAEEISAASDDEEISMEESAEISDDPLVKNVEGQLQNPDKVLWRVYRLYKFQDDPSAHVYYNLKAQTAFPKIGKVFMAASLCKLLSEGYTADGIEDWRTPVLELLERSIPDAGSDTLNAEERFLLLLGQMAKPGQEKSPDSAMDEARGINRVNEFIEEFTKSKEKKISYSPEEGLKSTLTVQDAEDLFAFMIYNPSVDYRGISSRYLDQLKVWLCETGENIPPLVEKTIEKHGEDMPWFQCENDTSGFTVLSFNEYDPEGADPYRGYVLSAVCQKDILDEERNAYQEQLAGIVYDNEMNKAGTNEEHTTLITEPPTPDTNDLGGTAPVNDQGQTQ